MEYLFWGWNKSCTALIKSCSRFICYYIAAFKMLHDDLLIVRFVRSFVYFHCTSSRFVCAAFIDSIRYTQNQILLLATRRKKSYQRWWWGRKKKELQRRARKEAYLKYHEYWTTIELVLSCSRDNFQHSICLLCAHDALCSLMVCLCIPLNRHEYAFQITKTIPSICFEFFVYRRCFDVVLFFF